MKYKLIATGILAGSLLSYSSSAFANTHKFPDVPAWADKYVNYLVDKKVVNGYPDGNFGSSDSLDRAAAAKIMTIALGIHVDTNAKPSFKDSQNHWATPYIAAAEKAGIVKGEGNGIFNPSGKVTRAAMATMLVNAYKLQDITNSNGQSKFDDLKGHWGERHANILIQTEISRGTEDGNSWSPNRPITRAEAAQFLAKSDQIHEKTKQEENDVVGIINDAESSYVTVTYKDSDGNNQEVNVNFPDESNSTFKFKKGDKVKVTNKDEWTRHKIPGGYAFLAPTDSISKVTDESHKQEENFVVGVINDAESSYVTVTYKDSDGNNQEVNVNFPDESNSTFKFKKGDKVKVTNKDEWTRHKIPGGYAFLAPTDSISKVNDEPNKQQENHVVGVINDAESSYVTVTYKDSDGNNQEVNVNFPDESNSNFKFKKGDKVKVTNKDEWTRHEIPGGYAFLAPTDSISKVNDESNKQQENRVMSKDKEQKLLAQLKKRSGTVIKKSEDSIEISSENNIIRAHVNPKILPNINIGDTVNVYAKAFEMDPILLKDLPFEARNAIIQKGTEQNILENQYEKITGKIVQKSENSILVSSNNITYAAEVSPKLLQDIVLGDTVNIYAASFESSPILLPNVPVDAISPIIEKR
ncbi:S-layer homology domain-containing protein [Bacillus thuringiensis]|uniref:S-layer homology domain-containing protein n=1 Tax=Bacillus thuringiensis TaxID=1428 RepID=UPI000CF936EE|nr:S-layer homology domain-containing protein [Bacillus thuringiensis]PQQ52206.1 cell wall hydrolase [Bacillus thuringiensis]